MLCFRIAENYSGPEEMISQAGLRHQGLPAAFGFWGPSFPRFSGFMKFRKKFLKVFSFTELMQETGRTEGALPSCWT